MYVCREDMRTIDREKSFGNCNIAGFIFTYNDKFYVKYNQLETDLENIVSKLYGNIDFKGINIINIEKNNTKNSCYSV